MALNTLNTGAISFKKLSGKAHTNQNFAVSEEGITTSVQSSYSTVFAQPITPLPVTSSGFSTLYSTNGIIERVKFQIDIIANTQIAVNQSQGYRLKLPSDYSTHPGKLYPKYTGGTYLHTALGKLQVVPSLYGKLKSDGSTEYDPILYKQDGSTVISKFDPINWYFDPFNGILFVEDPPAGFDVSANRPGYLEAFLYVGKYLDQVITSGSTGTTGGSFITASNGLQKIGNDIQLGGVLNGYTNIDLVGNNLQITASSYPSFDFSIGHDTLAVGVSHGGVIQLDPTQLTLFAPTGATVNIQASDPTTNSNNQIQVSPNLFDLFVSNSVTNDACEIIVEPAGFTINPYTNGGVTLANISYSTPSLTFNSQSNDHSATLVLTATGGIGGSQLTSLQFGSAANSFNITDARTGTTASGLEYVNDYSVNYTNRSLVDKGWVLSQITGGTGSSSFTASNGLTKIGNNIVLGGVITGDTIIGTNAINSHSLAIGNPNTNKFFNDISFYTGDVNDVVSGTAILDLNGGSTGFTSSINLSTYSLPQDCNTEILMDGSGIQLFVLPSDVSHRIYMFYTGGTIYTKSNKFIIGSGDFTTFSGASYVADYSAGFTARSIPDVAWVTGHTSGGSSTASNGLTKIGNDIQLGGTVTAFTQISITGSSTLFFYAQDDPNNLNNYTDININNSVLALTAGSITPNLGSQMQLRDNVTTLNVASGGTIFSNITVDNHSIIFSAVTGTENVGIGLSNSVNGLFIRDNRNVRTGIEYEGDYSSGYTSRSLVDKGYVDSVAGGSLTDGNGTTANGTAVDLGGLISQNTTISNNSDIDVFNFTIGNAPNGIFAQFRTHAQENTFTSHDGSNTEQLKLDLNGIAGNATFTDSRTTTKGLEYGADYSAGFTLRSVPDIAWITGHTSDGLTNGNGTTINGNGIDLGGTITSNIDLTPDTTDNYNLNIGSEFSSFSQINLNGGESGVVLNAWDSATPNTVSGYLNVYSTSTELAVYNNQIVDAFGVHIYQNSPSGNLTARTSLVSLQGSNTRQFDVSSTGFTFMGGEASYDADYSGNYHARSIPDVQFVTGGTIFTNIPSDLKLTTVGNGIYVKEGTNATMGVATLVGGTKVVNTIKVTLSSRIFLTSQEDNGVPGFVRVSTRSAGTSFTITSSSNTDTSDIAWIIIEPA